MKTVKIDDETSYTIHHAKEFYLYWDETDVDDIQYDVMAKCEDGVVMRVKSFKDLHEALEYKDKMQCCI